MENCQIRLYKKCQELENRIIELERNNNDKEVKKEFYTLVQHHVKCSSCQYERGWGSDAWCEKQNPNHSISKRVNCTDYKKRERL